MNRSDRMLAILLELQKQGTLRAEDLAATFEVSRRSIYRDLDALSEAGVPLVAVPGKGYSLMEGYFLPPLSFTAEEASILLLGTEVVQGRFDEGYRTAARSAAGKIEAVLPERLRAEVDAVRQGIRFVRFDTMDDPEELRKLEVLRRGVVERREVRFRYNRRNNCTDPELRDPRRANPYALSHVDGAWYMSGFCHERNALRTFRLSRMSDPELLAATFERPAGLEFPRRPEPSARQYEAQLLFDPESAEWVRETRYHYKVSEESHPDGLLVTLRSRTAADLLPWILSWGSHVRVLSPAGLADAVAAEAKKMFERHTSQ